MDFQMSAQKAEQIYDAKEVLQSIKDYSSKLEIRQTMDEVQRLSKDARLASQLEAARGRLEAKQVEITRMQADYEEWKRENA